LKILKYGSYTLCLKFVTRIYRASKEKLQVPEVGGHSSRSGGQCPP